MSTRSRKPSSSPRPCLSAWIALSASLVLCSGAIAAPSRAGSNLSNHPGYPNQARSELRREITAHVRTDALLRSARSRRLPRVQADPSSRTPFQRGDLLLGGFAGVQEYSPTGQLVQIVPGTSSAGPFCVTPNGTRLVLPGVGLFDNTGNPLPSNWASVAYPGRCVADGLGHVYIGVNEFGYPIISKYDITGDLLQTFTTTDLEIHTLAIDLAPDQCTMYYGSWGVGGGRGHIGRLNVCTDTLEPIFNGDSFVDDLRVLPNWQVIVTDDNYARLEDASGQFLRSYIPGGAIGANGGQLRTMSLDPDGTSFWVCCTFVQPAAPSYTDQIFRFDINAGQLLTSWAPNGAGLGTVYAPPLLGNANVARTVDSDTPGTAEAFSTLAGYSGQLTRLHLYVDASSSASDVIVGVYSDLDGHPGTLQEQATITNARPGSWNYVDVPPTPVTAGQRYWIAVLGPHGGGTVSFRDESQVGTSETSARHTLTSLPSRWSTGVLWASSALSGYGT
jgi:hypothetical protein